MSLFFKKKKKPPKTMQDGELMTARRGGEQGGEQIQSVYDTGGEKQPNRRYKRLSVAVGLLKYVVITLFFLFFMTMTFVYSSEINVENFRYILKDMNLKIPTGIEEYGDIYYVADIEQSFAVYRDDFVCVGRSSLDVVDMTGRQVQSTELKYINPRLVTGGKYMLVYDLSNTHYGIFNTFSELHAEALEYPISDADINDEGYYLIVTRDTEYKTAVYVYNKEMKRVYTYQSNDRYVYDAHLENDGSFTLYAADAENGSFRSEIIKGNIRSDQVDVTFRRNGTLMLSAGKTGPNSTAVLCSDCILFFSGNDLVYEYQFNGRVCRRFACGDGYSAVVLSSEGAGADSGLFVFDREGTLSGEADSGSDITALYVNSGSVFSLYTGSVERYEISTGKRYIFRSGHETKGLVFPDSEIMLAAEASRAYPVSVYDGFTELR